MRRARQTGFTLVEVIVVIAIAGIVAGFTTGLITRPLLAYQDVSRRAELVAAAETALRRMARDVQRALPNSVRVAAGGRALELMRVAEGARYRAEPGVNAATSEDHTAVSDVLDLGPDTSFNVLGRLGALAFSYGAPLGAGHRLVVYPTGPAVWSDAATGADPGAVTPAGTTITILDDTDEDQLTLSSPFEFALQAPRRRLYVVDQPVTFLCDLGAQTLTRHWSYAMTAGQPTDPAVAPLVGGSSGLLARRVTACTFSYQPGTPQRAGLVTVALTLATGGEQVSLLQQVHVVNVP